MSSGSTTETTMNNTFLPPPPPLPPLEIVATVPTDAKTVGIWSEFRAKAEALKTTAETLTVTSLDDKANMRLARQTRLSLREIRLGLTATHKELKAEALKTCNELDREKRELLALIEPLEERMKYMEDFEERVEAEARSQRQHQREELLRPYNVDMALFASLGDMTEAQWEAALAAAQDMHRRAEEVAEIERRQAEERARRQAEIEAENAKLRAEAAERDREQAAERARLAALAKLEADKAAALEAAAKEKEAAERAKAEAEMEAKRKAEAAPDRDKLMAFADSLARLPKPTCSTEAARAINKMLEQKLEWLAAWIKEEARKIS